MARGKAKFIRVNGKYKAFVRNYFWQHWKPLCLDDRKQLEFDSFTQLSELIRIDCFDEIILEIHKFSGLGR